MFSLQIYLFAYQMLRYFRRKDACPEIEEKVEVGIWVNTMASKPINIRWIRTGFQQ